MLYVVDDDYDVLGSLRFLLETEGFEVRTFRSGSALLGSSTRHGADCLVVDYKMAGIDGLELAERLRSLDVSTPIVNDYGLSGRKHHDESKFPLYVEIAMLLAVITGGEIIAVYLPFAKWMIVTALVTLSVVKFMFVIFYFMHLRWDKPICTILFFLGLVLAGGTMWARMQLFSVEAALPLPMG